MEMGQYDEKKTLTAVRFINLSGWKTLITARAQPMAKVE
jgi:hypothetical protein